MTDVIARNAPPSALFIFLAAILAYRTVDLLSSRYKLEQVLERADWWQGERVTFSVMRGAVRDCRRDARYALSEIKLLVRIYQEYLAGMVLLYVIVLAIIGYSLLLSSDVRAGGPKQNLVLAAATALVSLISSTINFLIEKAKTHV